MKLTLNLLNIINYLVLVILIVINFNRLSQFGLDICLYFLIASFLLLLASTIFHFIYKADTFLVSILINVFNLAIIFPTLLLVLF
ncbi:hypothetical protein ACUXOR_000143 [Staphylococcus pasteuri]|uniref:Uncharacterized protein n=1 Tax=Staphylococcus pasteuri TaxID=45972 RepID=A0ABY1H3D4_9STAP|nr:hypothetical protein CD121_00130 [Staphylococcus pasteuri]SFZ76102.1 hypothetical protein SAMN03097721_01326 [Staphylococcus pasteuri]